MSAASPRKAKKAKKADAPKPTLHVASDELAERAILGAILAAGVECYTRAAGCVDADDFFSEPNRLIFEACRVLAETGTDPDLVMIKNQLERDGTLAAAEGVGYVASLFEGSPDPANVEHYAGIVHTCARKRRLLFMGQKLMAAAGGENGTSEDALADVEAELAAIATGPALKGATRGIVDFWRPITADCLTTPPRRRDWLLTLPERQGGAGLLACGKVGFLASEGGAGKTTAQVALAASLITGRPWFGYYQVPTTVTGRVLLLLAEEDADDAHRKLWKIAEALRLTDSERAQIAARLVVIPLAGTHVALTAVSGSGLVETPLAQALRDRLVREAGPDGWALIGLDPLSRFAGGDVEGSNEAATRYVEVLETLAALPGRPTVLTSSHSSKFARRLGTVDLRGVTGLSDAARWVATLRREGKDEVIFEVKKSNYSLPCPPLRLRWHEETLTMVSGAEILDTATEAQAAQAAELDEDVRRVVEALVREKGLPTKDAIVRAAGLRASLGRVAVDVGVARGLIRLSGTERHRTYTAVPERVCAATPHTPHAVRDGIGETPCPSGTGSGRDRDGGRDKSADLPGGAK